MLEQRNIERQVGKTVDQSVKKKKRTHISLRKWLIFHFIRPLLISLDHVEPFEGALNLQYGPLTLHLFLHTGACAPFVSTSELLYISHYI